MSRKMRKADPASLVDPNEGSTAKPDEAPTDHEEAVEGVDEDGTEKSEDAASDGEHISHPRPEEGEEDQRGGVNKSDDDDEDDWGDEDEDEAEKADNSEEDEGALSGEAKRERNDESIKSLTRGDLEKSIGRLRRYADRGSTDSRKTSLLQKAQAGQVLSKSERDELFGLLGGQSQAKPSLSKSATHGLRNNDGLQKALDVSEYLAEQHGELTKSLGTLSSYIEKSDARQHDFNLVLAKALADVGILVQAVAEQVEAFGGQPARAPKSQGVRPGQVLHKGMSAGQSADDTLSKSQVLDAMEQILTDNMKKGGQGRLDGDEDISMAITKYESFNQISPTMHAAVMQRVKGTRAA